MPAKSVKQKKFMAAVANNPEFAEKVGVPTSVGEEFVKKEMMKSGKAGYKKGGKVRGCGMASGGAVRKCKMVKMKGA